MSIPLCTLQVIILSICIGSISVSSSPCEDSRCRTGSCNSTGACVCHLPDPSTILDGDRPFLGGSFCDEEQIMCDGTNSFWCEHGGSCEEIIHGENYTCKCPPSYSGLHCEHSGAPCGKMYCFHQAQCLVEDSICECPPDWKGSADCSLPTVIHPELSTNMTTTRWPPEDTRGSRKRFAVIFAVSISGAVVAFVVYSKRFFPKRAASVTKFQQLSQRQARDFLDEDEDDSLVPSVAIDDNSHL